MNNAHTHSSDDRSRRDLLRASTPPAARLRRARAPRGFSIVELAVSLGIFLMVGALITVAVARSLSASSAVRSDRVVEQALNAQLTKLSAVAYPKLLAGKFTVPSPCAGVAPNSGIAGQSCVDTAAGKLRIAYRHQSVKGAGTTAPTCSDVAKPSDLNDSLGAVGVCAQVLTVNGVAANASNIYTTETSARVNAPVPGYRLGQGAVRVTLNTDDNITGLSLYLVKTQSPTTIVSRAVVGGKSAYLSVPTTTVADSCTEASPCMIALSPTSTPNKDGGVTLYGAGVVGGAGELSSTNAGTNRVVPGAAIVVGADQVVHANASVARSGVGEVALEATDSAVNRVRQNPVLGSVCMWATFADGTTESTVPVCNLDRSGQLRLDTYQPYWDTDPTSTVRLAFPVGVPIQLSTDHPDGACYYAPGMRAPDATGTWVSSAACTSYTWGEPTVGADQVITLQPGVTTAGTTVRWTPRQGEYGSVPAAGYPDSASAWGNPRVRAGCATDATCAAVPQEKLEDATCPNKYCFSGGNGSPYIFSPAGGFYTDTTTGTVTNRSMYFADPEGGAFTLRLGALGFTGWNVEYRNTAGTYVPWTSGTTIASADGGVGLLVRYTRPAGDTSTRTLPIDATETVAGGTRTTNLDVPLYWHTTTATIDLSAVRVTQGQNTKVPFQVTGPNGAGVAAATPTVTGMPTGMTAQSTYVGPDKPGAGTLQLGAGTNTPAGTYNLTISATPAAARTFQVTVLPAAGTMSVSGGSVRQGGTLPVTAYVLDRAGANMSGVVAGFEVIRNGNTTNLVRPNVNACTTAANGSCQVSLIVAANAPQGVYQLYARSGDVSTPAATVTVLGTPFAARVDADSSALPRGRTTTVPVTIVDSNDEPVAGVAVTHPTAAPTGYAIATPTATTDANGRYSTNIAVAAGAPLAEATITPQALGVNLPYKVRAVDQSYSVATNPGPAINQGASGSLSVTVTSATGTPVPSKLVSFTSNEDGVTVAASGTTNAAGTVTVPVSVANTVRAGARSVTVLVDGQSYASRVVVGQSPSSFAAVGTIRQVGLGQPLDVYMLDGAGDPIVARSVTFDISGAGIVANPTTVTTSAQGVATFNVDVPVAVPHGNRTLTLYSGDFSEDVILPITQVASNFNGVTTNVALTGGTSVAAGGIASDPFGRPVPDARYTLEGLEDVVSVEATGLRTDRIALQDNGNGSESWRTVPAALPAGGVLGSMIADTAIGGRTVTYTYSNPNSPNVLLETQASTPFDPNKLYRVSARVRTTGATNQVSVGVLGYTATDTVLDRNGTSSAQLFYPVAASSEVVGTSWKTVTGYIRGNDLNTSAATSTNFQAPRGVRPGISSLRVIVQSVASTTSAGVHLDHVEVAEVSTVNALNTPLESSQLGEVALRLSAAAGTQIPSRQIRLVPTATTGGSGHTMNLTAN
jgi:5-hydroxyisourate hydrolase-like protein (transthyretin family)